MYRGKCYRIKNKGATLFFLFSNGILDKNSARHEMKKNIQKTDYFRDVLQNRVLVFTALFVTILCYGFAVTHQSIGVDDVARNFYLYSDGSWNMIRQGRLLHVLLNTVTRFVAFIPFFTEFVGASLFCLSALLFCGLFQTV